MQESRNFNIIGIIALVLIIAGFGAFYVWDKNEQDKDIQAFQEQDKINNQRTHERSKAVSKYLQDTQKSINDNIKGFVIFGDDYVAARNNMSFQSFLSMEFDKNLFYDLNQETSSSALLEQYKLKIPIVNHAVVNEDYNTIMSRFGFLPLYTAIDFTIPAETETVPMEFKTENNEPVVFAVQQEEKLGKLIINNVPGYVYFRQDEDKLIYNFLRSREGKEVRVKAGTSVKAESFEYDTSLIPIIFFGNNTDYDVKKFVSCQKKIMDNSKDINKRCIVITDTEKGSKLDKEMLNSFGDYYIRLDPILSNEIDAQQIADTVYKHMDSLGYLDTVKEEIEAAKEKIKAYDEKNGK